MNQTNKQEKEISIGFVPANKIDIVWDTIKPYYERALAEQDNPHATIDQVKDALKQERAWAVVITFNNNLIAALMCSRQQYPARTIMYVELCSGEYFEHWKYDVIEFLKEGARNIGASTIEWRGRKGFEKAYKDIAKVRHVAIEIEVN